MNDRTKARRGIPACFPFHRALSVCLLLFCCLLITQPGQASSKTRQQKNPSAAAVDQPAQQKAPNELQFMGVVDVGERQVVLLLPGETVAGFDCKQGDSIKKGQPVVRLNNDAITNGIEELLLKKDKVKEGISQLQLAQLEKRQREKQLQVIEGRIKTEETLKKQIQGYASPALQQMETQRMSLSQQLEISSVHIAVLQETAADGREVLKMINDQLGELELRRQDLTIKASFDARVFFLSPDPGRLPPGRMVCELRNETFHLVRGRIIQYQRNLLKAGDTVKVALDSSPDDFVDGSVQSIEYMQQGQKEMKGYSSFEVVIRVDAQAKWLRVGMVVSISKPAPSGMKSNQ